MRRLEFIVLAILVLLFTYLLALGTTFNGVLSPEFKSPTLIIMTLTLIIWFFIRWRRGWQWHKTLLDWVFLLWGGAFVLSLVTNLDAWRRIVMALWYMAVYVGVWYVLQDVVTNWGIKRKTLVDALLITGLVVMFFAYWQVQGWINTQLPLIRAGLVSFNLPRPVSTIGNPNALAAFFVVLTPFVLSRVAGGRNLLERIVMSGYALAAVLLMLLTFSRGGWLGLLAAVAVWGILLLLRHDLLSPRRLREWLETRSRSQKITLLSSSVSILIVICVVLLLIVNSLTVSTRSLAMRTILYQPAIDLFVEKPLTGHGLFTFGRGYERLVSLPPSQPHSHAHNIILNIAAELGLVGLAVLFVTGGVIVRAMRRNWQAASKREYLDLMGAIAAVVGFAIHHMLDTPAMMPAIALTGLLALALALAPFEGVPVTVIRRRLQTMGLLAGWAVLLVTGFWSAEIYRQYVTVLSAGITSKDYAGAAEQLQEIVDADPALGLYHQQQAYLWGLAASEGDTDSAEKAIRAYERFLELEPQSAISWANQAALYWQINQPEQALKSMQQAVSIAPKAWQLLFDLATYAEVSDDTETARYYFQQAGNVLSRMYPEWEQTELRRSIAGQIAVQGVNQVVLSLEDGTWEEALELWESLPPEKTPAYYVVRLMLALDAGARDEALTWLAQAREVVVPSDSEHAAWIHLGMAQIAQFDGDESTMIQELTAAQELLVPSLGAEDFVFGTNIAHFQFLHLTISRQFLPQLYYPTADPLLVRLLTSLN